jgi:hypothetical protein
VQGNLLHVFWAERYGITLEERQKETLQIRPVSRKLERIWALKENGLSVALPLEKRQVGNCRDFATMLCALLRHIGIPARARCGFGVYFEPDHYEDHWVCEYWNATMKRWVLVDAQLDALQVKALGVQFDPLDVPYDQFILAGQAWQDCRQGKSEPEKFGIFNMHGMWFIWGNVVRDFMALNKIEILPWDWGWGYLTKKLDDPLPGEQDLRFYDRIVSLTLAGDRSFSEIRQTYVEDDNWLPPQDVLQGVPADLV